MPRPRIPLALALVTLAAGGAVAWFATAPARPFNVVLITLDTTRADYLSCYGAPEGSTPNLDALAEEGTLFEHAMSSASVTPVSHASILTGLEPKEHGIRFLAGLGCFLLREGIPYLPSMLKARGYRTLAVHSAFPVSSHYGFQRDFDVFESLEGRIAQSKAGTLSWDLPRLQRRSDETTDIALRHLSAVHEPYFLWLHYWDPHDEVRVPPEEFLAGVPRDAQGRPIASRALYAAEVRYVDHEIGRLVAGIKARGDYERTIFVVVADHGEGLGDHNWNFHRILYEEQIRVPLIVRVPGVPPTDSVPSLVRSIDIAPTILDYARVSPPRPLNGRSLRALLEGRTDAPRIGFADQVNGYDLNAKMVEDRPFDDFLYAAADDRWKLVYRPMHPEQSELFDLASDPRELKNLYTSVASERTRLLRALTTHAGWVLAPCPPDPRVQDTAEMRANLAAIGYTPGHDEGLDTARWSFTCVDHPGQRWDELAPCPTCAAPALLIGKPK